MVGETVSHYRILDKIGGGGMGVIYEAEDLRLGRHVALKFIPDHLLGDSKSLDRFEREARAASRLNHPNICIIHDIESNNGHPFIVMEKLDGESLKQRMQGKALEVDGMLDIAVQVAEALEALHGKGIIHRDIKPGNIFIIPGGRVKMLDFGLAKMSRDSGPATEDTPFEDSLTAIGVVPGTAVYMAPEQARGEDLDPRSDIFSFGVVLYEMATGKKPFRGTNVVTTLDALMHQKPVAPRSLNPGLPPEIEGVIGKAMEKERINRYQSAAQIRADLQHLRSMTESAQKKGSTRDATLRVVTNTFSGGSAWQKYALLGMAGLMLAVLAGVGAWFIKHRTGAASAGKNTIAVLPLQNTNGDFSVDYLRMALADEIASVLTDTRSLDVRPSSSTRKYVSADVDPQQAGHELHVANVLTGRFIKRGEQLQVTLEAVDVAGNRLLWQTSFSGPAEDEIKLQEQLGKQIRSGLLPLLGAASQAGETGTKPKDALAYDLYLHSLALSHDPGENKNAIVVLEEVVRRDPSYARAWEALCTRYYYDSDYGGGGETVFEKSNTACTRALALDPNRIAASGQLIENQVGRGELSKAYPEAAALVKARGESAEAHFTLAYVLRYAGMLDEAGRECDTALRLDPNYQWRSCAWTFLEAGNTKHAMDFIRLDRDSEWASYMTMQVLLREGKVAEARAWVKGVSTNPHEHRDLLEACLGLRPESDLDKITHDAESAVLTELDPERWYYQGAVMAFCGRKDIALEMINRAVEQNYCAYTALLEDPLVASLRSSGAEFDKVLTAAHECQQAVGVTPSR